MIARRAIWRTSYGAATRWCLATLTGACTVFEVPKMLGALSDEIGADAPGLMFGGARRVAHKAALSCQAPSPLRNRSRSAVSRAAPLTWPFPGHRAAE